MCACSVVAASAVSLARNDSVMAAPAAQSDMPFFSFTAPKKPEGLTTQRQHVGNHHFSKTIIFQKPSFFKNHHFSKTIIFQENNLDVYI